MSYIILGGGGRQGQAIGKYLGTNRSGPWLGQELICVDNQSGGYGANIKKNVVDFLLEETDRLQDAIIIDCLPPQWSPLRIERCREHGVKGYIGLGGDDDTTARIRQRFYNVPFSIIPDCGLAPGLPSSVAGKAAREGWEAVRVYAGGLAASSSQVPYGYVRSFSTASPDTVSMLRHIPLGACPFPARYCRTNSQTWSI
jgi:saccharopine dehydrogenase-like NADP-dependent oxidoreductase